MKFYATGLSYNSKVITWGQEVWQIMNENFTQTTPSNK